MVQYIDIFNKRSQLYTQWSEYSVEVDFRLVSWQLKTLEQQDLSRESSKSYGGREVTRQNSI